MAVAMPIYDAGTDANWSPWTDDESQKYADVALLRTELFTLLKSGLPATVKTAGNVLPHLRSVVARSVHPYDVVSRVASLNQLLVRVMDDLREDDHGVAFATLFGLEGRMRFKTLTDRRQEAATLLSYEVTHFRKHIEPKMLEQLATTLYEDLLRYKRRVRRAPQAEEPTGDTPIITIDDFTHQEELVSRIWQHVYGWRAELIAAGRLQEGDGYESQAEDHRQTAMRQETQLRELITEYTTTYGERLIKHGDAEFDVDAVARLIGRCS